ncbi:MAG: hypothetical protein WBZ36_13670 [Candidatus Nitrosopolaris sp.]
MWYNLPKLMRCFTDHFESDKHLLARPNCLQFCRLICALQQTKADDGSYGPIGVMYLDEEGEEELSRNETCRFFLVLVKGPRDVQPLMGPKIPDVICTIGGREELAGLLLASLLPTDGTIVAFTDYEQYNSTYFHDFKLPQLITNSSILVGKSAYTLIAKTTFIVYVPHRTLTLS